MRLHSFACLLLALAGCGGSPEQGDCGPVLSSGECAIARTQIGTFLSRGPGGMLVEQDPPADPSNRFAQGSAADPMKQNDERNAADLGQRLFYDRCLSSGDQKVGCVTCHNPQVGFIDTRDREVLFAYTRMEGDMPHTYQLPLIKDPTPERQLIPPPAVEPQLDLAGAALAYWDPTAAGGKGMWRGRSRRPATSVSSLAGNFSTRNSPTMYNLGYGAAVPPADSARTYGANWVPWDGRYDSVWSLVADVLEFGATQRTNRAYLAVRVSEKHRAAYTQAFGALPDFDYLDGTKFRYPLNASPNGVKQEWKDCWKWTGQPGQPACPDSNPLTPIYQGDINTVFANSGKALSAFLRRLRSTRSPYDLWASGDPGAMSVAAQRGLRLFIGKAECVLCHSGPNFTDWRFHNLGVPAFDPERHAAGSDVPPMTALGAPAGTCPPGAPPTTKCPDPGHFAFQDKLSGRCQKDTPPAPGSPSTCQNTAFLNCFSPFSDVPRERLQSVCLPAAQITACSMHDADPGACQADPLCTWAEVSQGATTSRCIQRAEAVDQGALKTPSLRNVARTWPYMHNGALSDFGPAERGETSADDPTPHLLKVVEFYNQGGGMPVFGTRDPLIRPLHLAAPEMADLVEFLKALTDESIATDPLNPRYPGVTMPADLADTSDCPRKVN